ncbi:MAG: PhoH family protein [Chthoniobacterales bacterium]
MTWEFQDARSLHALYGGNERLLRKMEEMLDITIVTRDGWFRVDGIPEAIQRAQRTLDQLIHQQRQGVHIGEHEFLQALEHSSVKPSEQSLERIQCSFRKPPIFPKTESQRTYLRFMEEYEITFGIGPAGTGKTYLAMAKAVSALKQEKISSIILTRPAVEAGEALGFLPGELQEKIFPYLRPLYDALHDMLEPEEIQRYLDKNIIQIAPLAYMRGRTLNNAFIILDESQNTTTEQMFMFLTRIGLNSQCVITGDPTQIDLPRNKPSGLIEALQALASVSEIGFHYFKECDVVRHSLVQAVIKAYQHHRALT